MITIEHFLKIYYIYLSFTLKTKRLVNVLFNFPAMLFLNYKPKTIVD